MSEEAGASRAARTRTPSWLDTRLVLGVVLVLVSVVVGARLVASADDSVGVWSARADLAAGTTLAADDVAVTRVRLPDNAGRYVAARSSPVGSTLSRAVSAGELLPVQALQASPEGRLVTIPVGRLHVPQDLRRGHLVDVFASVTSPGEPVRTSQVLERVVVQDRTATTGGLTSSGADIGVTVLVPTDRAAAVVAAVQGAQIDVLRVLDPAAADPGKTAG